MRRLPLILALSCIACGGGQQEGPPPQAAAAPEPTPAVQPTRYEIHLDIDPNGDKHYRGKMTITAQLATPQRRLELRSHGLTVATASVSTAGHDGAITATWVQGEQTGSLELAEEVGPGEVSIAIDFTGVIQNETEGGLRWSADYGDWRFWTDLGAGAHHLFPCFATPSVFAVTLTMAPEMIAVAGTDAEPAEPTADGRVTMQLADTPVTLPEEVAFVGGFFVLAAETTKGSVPIRLWRSRGAGKVDAAKGQQAAATFVADLAAFEAWLEQPYPHPALDVVGGAQPWGAAGLLVAPDPYLSPMAAIFGGPALRWTSRMALARRWLDRRVPSRDERWFAEALALVMIDDIDAEPPPMLQNIVTLELARSPVEPSHLSRAQAQSRRALLGFSQLLVLRELAGREAFVAATRALLSGEEVGFAGFLAALGSAAGLELGGVAQLPFSASPQIRAGITCAPAPVLELTPAEPLAGDLAVPVCVQVAAAGGSARHCALVREASRVELTGVCPAWVAPSIGASFHNLILPPALATALAREGLGALADREKALAAGTLAALTAQLPPKDLRAVWTAMAADSDPMISLLPADRIRFLLLHVAADDERDELRVIGQELYKASHEIPLWVPGSAEDPQQRLWRDTVLPFLALWAHDSGAQSDALAAGLKLLDSGGGPSPDPSYRLPSSPRVSAALGLALRAGGGAELGRAWRLEVKPSATLARALGHVQEAAMASKVRGFALQPEFANSYTELLAAQLSQRETRADTKQWLEDHWAELRSSHSFTWSNVLSTLDSFLCGDAEAQWLQSLFTPEVCNSHLHAEFPIDPSPQLDKIKRCGAHRERWRAASKGLARGD